MGRVSRLRMTGLDTRERIQKVLDYEAWLRKDAAEKRLAMLKFIGSKRK